MYNILLYILSSKQVFIIYKENLFASLAQRMVRHTIATANRRSCGPHTKKASWRKAPLRSGAPFDVVWLHIAEFLFVEGPVGRPFICVFRVSV